ncbi:MAG TPA: hypothetical protein VL361_14830, partial [Candidatus Limnocylindrales bacterium]|nr:hypothetical protein [Candidatus Limnocylindrales bacterium]
FTSAVDGEHPLNYQWTFNGQLIPGATLPSLVLTNVQRSQSGVYAFSVTNTAGGAISSNALLTVNFPPANVLVLTNSVGVDGSVTLPIVLIANGNEHAIGFSLNFSSSQLSYVDATLGSGTLGGTLVLNTNLVSLGKLGVAIELPTGSILSAGTQEVAEVSFLAAALTHSSSTPVSFADQPTTRQLSDPQANILPATYTGALLSIPAADFEGDLAPRPGGDRALTIIDWVQEGRYAARLDYPTNASEYQRADCAPRSTSGDGAITVADWVQAGRYVAGLDAANRAGGPTNDVGPNIVGSTTSKVIDHGSAPRRRGNSSRQIQVLNSYLAPGQPGTISVVLQAQGDENALGFSLAFDRAVFAYNSAMLGANAAGATMNINVSEVNLGRLAIVLARPTGASFQAGAEEVVEVNLTPVASALGSYTLALTDQPIVRQVVDPNATPLSTAYINGTVLVNPQPTLSIARANQNILLSWPLWATNFTLQQADSAMLASTRWTNVPVTIRVTNNQATAALPITSSTRFYRLQQ